VSYNGLQCIGYDVAMAREKEFAVIKFTVDDTYCTCSKRHKAADSAAFFVGNEVTIQWSRHEQYQGTVVFTDGKQFQ